MLELGNGVMIIDSFVMYKHIIIINMVVNGYGCELI